MCCIFSTRMCKEDGTMGVRQGSLSEKVPRIFWSMIEYLQKKKLSPCLAPMRITE